MPKSHIIYYNCNQKGHYSNECLLPKKKLPALLNSLDNSTPIPLVQPSGDCLSALHTNDLYKEYNHAINEFQADSLFQLDANNNDSSFDIIHTAKKFHIRFHLLKSSMILGANNLVAEVQYMALSVPVTCGKLHFHHHFCILLLSQSRIVIFGHDKLKRFGLEISGIPINFPSASPSLPDNSNVTTSKQYHEKSFPPSKQQHIINAI
ncbi:hypothetical protein QOT17_022183 [Balamuthia mandrillaris]